MSSLARTASERKIDAGAVVARRFGLSAAVTERFFDDHASEISRACLALARRFERGGRLLVFGSGAEATDAHHVAVEFVHPVLVGKRALPALALTADAASLSGAGRGPAPAIRPDPDLAFEHLVRTLGRGQDIALGISRGAPAASVRRGLEAARTAGLLTIAIEGAIEGAGDAHERRGSDEAGFTFVVPTSDPLVAQEVQETLYHVIWELVHVFLDRVAR